MTAKDAIDAAIHTETSERLRGYMSECAPRGRCRHEPLDDDPGRWTFCPDGLTVYDDFGNPVNPLPEFRTVH